MQTIVDFAKKDLGKTEKPNNGGFTDPILEQEMKEDGFQKGFAWCAIICEKWAEDAFPEKVAEFDRLFSASAVTTFHNFKKAGYKISSVPVVGSIVIWQRYKNGVKSWQGHAGIVSEVIDDKTFLSIEGNGSVGGSREGTTVVQVKRKIVQVANGLNVLGFICLD